MSKKEPGRKVSDQDKFVAAFANSGMFHNADYLCQIGKVTLEQKSLM